MATISLEQYFFVVENLEQNWYFFVQNYIEIEKEQNDRKEKQNDRKKKKLIGGMSLLRYPVHCAGLFFLYHHPPL